MQQESSNLDTTAQLRSWLRECPAIQKSKRFRVDFLSDNPTEYALFAVPSTLKYHENILGDYVLNDDQEVDYIFASREIYGADVRQNLENAAFYSELNMWIIEQNNLRNFPEIADGKVYAITPTLTAFPVQVGSSAAKYQIQIKMKYRRT